MRTYLDYYNKHFANKIKAIDLFLKEIHTDIMDSNTVSDLLDISDEEIKIIMSDHNIQEIDKVSFFVLMQNGSSPVCKLFKRELQRKMPHFYSFYDISYIYQIPYEHVVEGAKNANLNSITSENIHELFEHIHMAS